MLKKIIMQFSQNDMSGLRKIGASSAYNTVATYSNVFDDYLNRFHDQLFTKDDYDNLSTLGEKLRHIKKEQKDKFIQDLLFPEKCINAKLPSTIPIPTSSFKMHNTVTVSTNALGNLALVFNPFMLGSTTLYINNHSTLDGASSNSNFSPVNIGQNIPSLYAEYRLVSASLIVTCKSSLLNLSGTFSGGVILDQNLATGSSTHIQQYGNFNNIDDSMFSQIVQSRDGIRLLYFPQDVKAEQFFRFTDYYQAFNWVFYAQGCQPSANVIRIDFHSNWEAIPSVDYLQYIPRSNGILLSSDDKQKCYEAVQTNAVSIPQYNIIPNTKPETNTDITKEVNKLGDTLNKVGSVLDLLVAAKAQQGKGVTFGNLLPQNITPKGEWLNKDNNIMDIDQSLTKISDMSKKLSSLF